MCTNDSYESVEVVEEADKEAVKCCCSKGTGRVPSSSGSVLTRLPSLGNQGVKLVTWWLWVRVGSEW